MQRTGGVPNDSAEEGTRWEPATSIIICTRNRVASLERCLASLTFTEGVADSEVVIVDNGSSDGTVGVAERWEGSLPVRYAWEPQPGLSNARNRALSVAEGDVMAFLDDDVLVSPDWLTGVRRAFARSDDVGGVAGRVELAWPDGRPTWLPASREVWFARLDLGSQPRRLDDREHPVGANMAVSRSAADAAGRFDPDLGYSANRLLGNEEVDFMERVRRAGFELAYEPSMSVDHVIAGDRIMRRYLLRRLYSQGRSDVRMRENGVAAGESLRSAAGALSHAALRGWRGDLRRLRGSGGWETNLVDVSAGRARQLGRVREHIAMAVASRPSG